MNDAAKIGADQVVTMEYTLRDASGEVLDTSDGDEPLTYLHGHGQIVPGLEKALEGKAVGDTAQVTVAPEEGYGEYDMEKVLKEPRSSFDFEVEVGQVLEAQVDDEEGMEFLVTDVDADTVTLDGNHPLSGKALNFDVKVVGIRPATKEELDHGHVHGSDHDHDH